MNDHDSDQTVSWPAMLQRIAIGAVGALVIGAGTMLVSTTTQVKVDTKRVDLIESDIHKIPDIATSLAVLNGKVDVLNQKIDDAAAIQARKGK